MKTLLVLAPAPTVAASTRFRLEQFFPALRAAGVEPRLRPFLDEAGFRLLYRPGAPLAKLAAAARALAGRLGDLVRAARADAVLVHREAALVGPPVLEWLLARGLARPLLFDLDDAVWVPYASPTYGALLSRLLKAPQKTDFTLAAARRIIAGNRHLADYARRFNPKVDVVPTVVDTDAFRPAPPTARELPVLGWIGTHSSSQYLRALVPALARLARRHRFLLRVVGGGSIDDAPGLQIDRRAWSLDREVADFQSLDVGLYPLADDPWAHGKSGFKAVQYMACGVPVVASPVGVTRDMIRDGENGYLAATPDEWEARLAALVDDAALRRRLGAAGRAEAEARWSLRAHAPRFVEIVRAVVEEAA
jgi:glycosyltransferase involved in cell wall biosynthesis